MAITSKNFWTECFLAFLDNQRQYPEGHRWHYKDYATWMDDWYNDWCND